jgi:hypothetical protein
LAQYCWRSWCLASQFEQGGGAFVGHFGIEREKGAAQ